MFLYIDSAPWRSIPRLMRHWRRPRLRRFGRAHGRMLHAGPLVDGMTKAVTIGFERHDDKSYQAHGVIGTLRGPAVNKRLWKGQFFCLLCWRFRKGYLVRLIRLWSWILKRIQWYRITNTHNWKLEYMQALAENPYVYRFRSSWCGRLASRKCAAPWTLWGILFPLGCCSKLVTSFWEVLTGGFDEENSIRLLIPWFQSPIMILS